MNKQELKEKVKSLESFNPCTGTDFAWGFDECRNGVLSLIQALDEPQKVKVPAFVAEWIEMNKAGDVPIMFILKYFGEWFEMSENKELNDETCEWVIRNPEKFMRAWLDGYEVEEEPKYYIQLSETTWGTYLVKGEDNELFVWQNATCGTKFTEQEIKSIDERYWPFAVPVEKV